MDINLFKEELEELAKKAKHMLNETASKSDLEQVKVSLLGKKGLLTLQSKKIKEANKEDKPTIGQELNRVRSVIQTTIAEKEKEINDKILTEKIAKEAIDVTLPGNQIAIGHQHVITKVKEEIEDLFIGLGYQVIDGREVESDHYNFEMMNLPKDHPARDMQDTFYVTENELLRTQTSPMQARTLEVHDFTKGPLKMISPGRVFRRDSDDATHSHQFHQIEGLVVAENITMSDLKGTLDLFAKSLFGSDRKTRLRPSYFPFTEPSVEVDVSCFKCNGKGCRVCKQTGWIEILGSGMVHPNVLEMAGIDGEKYSGFAFGLGIDRIAMLKYGIDDIRHLYQNDIRFLKQF